MKTIATIASAIAAAALTASASAQYTTVKSPPGRELSHAEMLTSALGESFAATGRGNRDLSSGSMYASRVKDTHDQMWNAGTYNATILGRQAGYKHTFGFVDDGAFTPLLRTNETGSSTTATIDSRFTWAIQNDKRNGGDRWSSRKNHNRDRKDHMVTYALYDNDHLSGFVLFFEDLPSWHSDRDFNDAAVLLSIVPTPQAAGLVLTGLGGIGLAAGRRRRES
jgi:hypothetical protein